ncbi:siderophore iron transporter [Histoplasma capsulatum]|uniref:Siderophore iron transporter n=1 Tax=Ajellomyces capsulatus TaxID=5037 RepID=A0A8A1MGC7_AJECA|nr:siderophore iron transporter [Histoplasma capsulatum]
MIKRVIRIKNVVKSANRSSASSNVLSASGSRYRIDEELRSCAYGLCGGRLTGSGCQEVWLLPEFSEGKIRLLRSSLHLWCCDAIFYCLVLSSLVTLKSLSQMGSAFLSKLQTHAPVAQPQVMSSGAAKEAGDLPQEQGVASDAEDQLSADAQDGVRKIQATTRVWSKGHLIFAYVMIWVITFVDTMQQGMSNSLVPYVTSSFRLHSLTASTMIMSNIIGGLIKLPLAKVLDIWGRPQGFLIMVGALTIGLVMMAACNNVKTYAAAQVFYWVGYNGMSYTISIFIADTSALKNRALMFAFVSSPYIATVWVGGPLATVFLNGPGFRWGYGAFAIITPAITFPLRTYTQSLKHYFIEFDIIGIILLASGLALFLLPFSLYSYQKDQWRSSLVISMIIVGGLLLIAFALYEKYRAPACFIPFELLFDRTVLGACILAASFRMSISDISSCAKFLSPLLVEHAS